MTFERDSRVSRFDFPLWWMDISDRAVRNKRRLIIEPRTTRQLLRPAELCAWIEEDRPEYCYVTKSITAKPRGAPTLRIEPVMIESSHRSVPAKTRLEAIVIDALATQQLISDSAKSALHDLFWTHFVLDDDGLSWLYKYSKAIGNFYAVQRLNEYTQSYDNGEYNADQARYAIKEAMRHDDELGTRMGQRVTEDEAFQHAIEALLLTDEAEETQYANVRRLVELNVTDKDLVFASIVDASRSDHAFRGLRACQRAERDPKFFAAIAAIAHRERTPAVRSRFISAFIRKSEKIS